MGRTLPDVAAIARRLRPFFTLPGTRLVVLFGSVAGGRIHAQSDIDLGVDLDGDCDILEVQDRIVDLLEDDRVDVVELRRADPVLAYQIAQGVPLFESPVGRFREFALHTWKSRLDYEPYMEIERRYVRNRVGHS